ncbi:hypothetical protein GGR51DRAFT_251749 [Nemania sp. FL0031]|nr:hypothetical protein GGR51DRAFT_251749 [Nemania sp. FL0031]
MSDAGNHVQAMSSSSKLSLPPLFSPARKTPFLARPLSMNFMQSHKTHDWFFCLACAMVTAEEPSQGKMLAKLYCFLLDFIPRGLSGQFDHVRGSDVMDHMLCSSGETAPSRHRFSKDAEAAWVELEAWMKKGRDWQEAVKQAKADHACYKATDSPCKRKAPSWKAPGLFSPAGMIALLAIAHPEKASKLSERVGQLQINWMAGARDKLDVKVGFWKGIRNENLYECFLPDDCRRAEIGMLADYTRLFGKDFRRCRRNMKPYLPPWAQHLTLQLEPSIVDHNTSDGESDGERCESATRSGSKGHDETNGLSTPTLVDQLRQRLDIHTVPILPELKAWLNGQLPTSGTVLPTWCKRWARRILDSKSLQEQLIIRSLFLRSISRLRSFYSTESMASFATPEAYMLLDIEDAKLKMSEQDSAAPAISQLDKLADVATHKHTMAKLASLVGTCEKHFIAEVSARKAAFFIYVLRDPDFAQYGLDVIRLDELRTRIIALALERYIATHGSQESRSQTTPFADETVEALKLTTWQRLLLLIPGQELLSALTNEQFHAYQQTFLLPNAAQDRPTSHSNIAPVFPDGLDSITKEEAGKDMNYVVDLLFGEVPTPSSPTPTLPDIEPLTPTSLAQLITTSQGQPITESPKQPSPVLVLPVLNQPSYSSTTSTLVEGHILPNHTADSEERDDYFTGMTSKRGAKRLCDFAGPPSKRVRIGDMTREELATELQAGSSHLKEFLAEQRAGDKARIEQLMQSFRTDITAQIQAMNTHLLQELRNGKTELESRITSLAYATTQQSEDARHEIAALKTALVKEPIPGETGYLARHCPAPAGWDQRAYESLSFRGASFYIAYLGNPPGGVSADQDAFQATRIEFPTLPQKHLIAALKHIHILMYNRPFSRVSD